jgi:branched-chain amino acid transport system permease protein
MAMLGLNLLLGFSGQVCLAQGAFFACGAYTTAILSSRYGLDPLLTLPFATALTGLAGVFIGLPALRLGGLQLAILTFGIAVVVPQLILKLDQYTNGVTGLSIDLLQPPAWFPGSYEAWLYALCILAATLCVAIMLRLLRGDFGRSVRALRDNPLVAESLGVNLTRTRLRVFAVRACFAGLAGGLCASLSADGRPQSFVAAKSIEILIGAIVGGVATIGGAFVGALFVVFVPEWTAELNPAIGGLIYGLFLILMILLAREGLVGLLNRGLGRFLSGCKLAFFNGRARAARLPSNKKTGVKP